MTPSRKNNRWSGSELSAPCLESVWKLCDMSLDPDERERGNADYSQQGVGQSIPCSDHGVASSRQAVVMFVLGELRQRARGRHHRLSASASSSIYPTVHFLLGI